jgi:hypothetical protein
MKIKPGVQLQGIQPGLVVGLMVADGIYLGAGEVLTITSGTDGIHSRQSKHYLGYAADIRTRDLNHHTEAEMQAALVAGLGDEFIVILESDHIHIHFKGSPP